MDDDYDDLNASKATLVTDTDSTDQDSLDEKIDSEQRLRNHLLWASFQNTASCITKLYNDKAQSTPSPWVPFQNAASNLATLYKDCIDSQRRFAKIGYQHGRRRKMRELTKLLIKHKIPTKVLQKLTTAADYSDRNNLTSDHQAAYDEGPTNSSIGQLHNTYAQTNTTTTNNSTANTTTTNTNVSSILNVNQLNLGNDDTASLSAMQPQSSDNQLIHQQHQTNPDQQQQASLQILLSNNEDDLFTFQQALAQPAISGGRIKMSNQQQNHSRRPCTNSSGYLNTNRPVVNESKTEEERLSELNQFLCEEYHRHVGSRKRSCSNSGGDAIKRFRE